MPWTRLLKFPQDADFLPSPSILRLFALEWNKKVISEKPHCTHLLGDGVPFGDVPLRTFVDEMLPPACPELLWNPFTLQDPFASLQLRLTVGRAMKRLEMEKSSPIPSLFSGENAPPDRDPQYRLHPGKGGVLYSVMSVREEYLSLEAVDPLVYIDGMRLLRKIRLTQSAFDRGSLCYGYDRNRVVRGDLLWIYQLDLDAFNSDFPETNPVLNVKKFAFVKPHSPLQTRLARYLRTERNKDRNEIVLSVEGVLSWARVPASELRHLDGYSEDLVEVSCRPHLRILSHFSAPPKDEDARAKIVELISESRRLTLTDDCIGVTDIRIPSQGLRDQFEWRRLEFSIDGEQRQQKEKSAEKKKEPSEEVWRDVVRVMQLGATGVQLEEVMKLACGMYSTQLVVHSQEENLVIASIKFPSFAREEGWKKDQRILLRSRGHDDWHVGIVCKVVQEGSSLTVWLSLDASSILSLGRKVQLKLDSTQIHRHALNNFLCDRTLVLSGNGEKVMRDVYRKTLTNGESSCPPPVSDLTTIPTHCGDVVLDREQRLILANVVSPDVYLLNIDAGAGTGVTTTVAMAILYALMVLGDEVLVIGVAVTNSAVEVLTNKIKSLDSTANVTWITSKSTENSSSVLQQMIECGSEENVPTTLKDHSEHLQRLSEELAEIPKRENDCMTAALLLRRRMLQSEMQQSRRDAMEVFLDHRKPAVITATLDTLISSMKIAPIKQYVSRAKRVIVMVDEASQMPELALPALCSLLPHLELCVAGDARQLPPHNTTNSTDSKLAGCGVAAALLRSRDTPQIRLRQCRSAHPALVQMSSALFYGKSLVASARSAELSLSSEIRIPQPSSPICVITTKGADKVAVDGSWFNEAPEEVAIDLVTSLLAPIYGVNNVGVISFYKEQVARIWQKSGIEATTINTAQAAKYEVVVILTTRSENTVDLELREDRLRVNVALTRGRRAVFIIGNEEFLRKACWWRRIYQHACVFKNVITDNEAYRRLGIGSSKRASYAIYRQADANPSTSQCGRTLRELVQSSADPRLPVHKARLLLERFADMAGNNKRKLCLTDAIDSFEEFRAFMERAAFTSHDERNRGEEKTIVAYHPHFRMLHEEVLPAHTFGCGVRVCATNAGCAVKGIVSKTRPVQVILQTDNCGLLEEIGAIASVQLVTAFVPTGKIDEVLNNLRNRRLFAKIICVKNSDLNAQIDKKTADDPHYRD